MTHPDTIIVIGVKTLMLFPLAAQKSVPFHLSFFLFLLERKKERKRENVDTLVDRTHRRSAIMRITQTKTSFVSFKIT